MPRGLGQVHEHTGEPARRQAVYAEFQATTVERSLRLCQGAALVQHPVSTVATLNYNSVCMVCCYSVTEVFLASFILDFLDFL